VCAEVAEERRYATGQTLVEERLKARGSSGRSLVSDRAQALLQLAAHGLECLRMPDCFPVIHDLRKRYALAIGRRLPQARKQLEAAEHARARHLAPTSGAAASSQAQATVEASRPAGPRWAEVHSAYRQPMATFSLTLHPCTLYDSTPQTSAQGPTQGHAALDALAILAQAQQCPARHATLQKVWNQLPALAARGDFWWAGVEQDVEQAALSAPWRTWARELLLPWVYGEHRLAHTRCARRKATMRQAYEAVRAAFDTHALTLRLPAQAREGWHAWATPQGHAWQRASSAVEGRNGIVAPLHHHQRG
jgi:Family of unknown function (DUF6399)